MDGYAIKNKTYCHEVLYQLMKDYGDMDLLTIDGSPKQVEKLQISFYYEETLYPEEERQTK